MVSRTWRPTKHGARAGFGERHSGRPHSTRRTPATTTPATTRIHDNADHHHRARFRPRCRRDRGAGGLALAPRQLPPVPLVRPRPPTRRPSATRAPLACRPHSAGDRRCGADRRRRSAGRGSSRSGNPVVDDPYDLRLCPLGSPPRSVRSGPCDRRVDVVPAHGQPARRHARNHHRGAHRRCRRISTVKVAGRLRLPGDGRGRSVRHRQPCEVARRSCSTGHRPAHRLRRVIVPVGPRNGHRRHLRGVRAAAGPQPVRRDQGRARRRCGGDRGGGRRNAGAPRRALVHRRARRTTHRMVVVRDLFDHVRRALVALRRPGRGGRAGRCSRCRRRRSDLARRREAPHGPSGDYGRRRCHRRRTSTQPTKRP